MHSTVHIILLPWRSFGNRHLPFVEQNVFISSLSSKIFIVSTFIVMHIDTDISRHVIKRRLFPNDLHGNYLIFAEIFFIL